MSGDDVNVIAIVENLELAVPRTLPARIPVTRPAPRIIEIGSGDTATTLRRQLNIVDDVDTDNIANGASTSEEQDGLELLRRLPPGTVLIQQVAPQSTTNNENHAEPIESVAETTPTRPKRTRKTKPMEVLRRNPMRTVTRKDVVASKVNRTTRQRLLTVKRRNPTTTSVSHVFNEPIANRATGTRKQSNAGRRGKKKRSRAYMSTRSVTRNLTNIGAIRQAPTLSDRAIWREWPVHGMHDRPVYHHQFGLTYEYNGRLFADNNGESYRDITHDAQQIEIVRVDPHTDSQRDVAVSLRPVNVTTTTGYAVDIVPSRQAVQPTATSNDRSRTANGGWSTFEQLQSTLPSPTLIDSRPFSASSAASVASTSSSRAASIASSSSASSSIRAAAQSRASSSAGTSSAASRSVSRAASSSSSSSRSNGGRTRHPLYYSNALNLRKNVPQSTAKPAAPTEYVLYDPEEIIVLGSDDEGEADPCNNESQFVVNHHAECSCQSKHNAALHDGSAINRDGRGEQHVSPDSTTQINRKRKGGSSGKVKRSRADDANNDDDDVVPLRVGRSRATNGRQSGVGPVKQEQDENRG